MKELVVISGKGGTGKTSIVASFAALTERQVLADCDVDAADLHLLLEPRVVDRADFSGGSQALVIVENCVGCGRCLDVCRFAAVHFDGPANDVVAKTYRVDPLACEGCGVCVEVCPAEAIAFKPALHGEWYRSETRFGPMIHARLGVGGENSGKLVSLVRTQAKETAEKLNLETVLIDGPPGIGCPVIASITGTDLVLIVTEPTLSALHDLERAADLTRHFGIETRVCINKWDLNKDLTARIEATASRRGIGVVGKVRYDSRVTRAQIEKQTVVEWTSDGIAEDIKRLYKNVKMNLDKQ